jgi:hypothetical protein
LGKRFDPEELVSFKELPIANSIQVDTLAQLLIEEGLISEQKSVAKVKIRTQSRRLWDNPGKGIIRLAPK